MAPKLALQPSPGGRKMPITSVFSPLRLPGPIHPTCLLKLHHSILQHVSQFLSSCLRIPIIKVPFQQPQLLRLPTNQVPSQHPQTQGGQPTLLTFCPTMTRTNKGGSLPITTHQQYQQPPPLKHHMCPISTQWDHQHPFFLLQ